MAFDIVRNIVRKIVWNMTLFGTFGTFRTFGLCSERSEQCSEATLLETILLRPPEESLPVLGVVSVLFATMLEEGAVV